MTPNALPSVPSMMSISAITPSRSATPRAARAVHADRMDLVEIGQGAVLLGQGDRCRRCRRCRRPSNRRSRRRSAWARRPARRVSSSSRCSRSLWRKTCRSPPPLRMPAIIEAWFSASEKMIRPGRILCQGRQRRLVGHIAGGEQQRRFLAVQVGQLALQLDVIVGGAGDVARAAGAGAGLVDGLVHGVEHDRVLALAEIVVGAPDDDVALARRRRGSRWRAGTRRDGASGRRRRGSGLRT